MPYLQGELVRDALSERKRCSLLTGTRTPKSAFVQLGKLQRHFYEPLVLLLALTQACMHNYAPRVPDSLIEVSSHSPEELFKDFVNKLCQICDNKRGGDVVTAICVLQYPDRVQ
jgi:hypothetical protein